MTRKGRRRLHARRRLGDAVGFRPLPSAQGKHRPHGRMVQPSQTRKDAFGSTGLFHYKWDDDSNSGYSFFGRAFRSYGATLATLPAAPTAANLAHAQIYIIASPDIPSKNPTPHYMDKTSADAIVAWVRAGGTLLLFSNDRDNTEFTHFDTLADRFGLHFNPVLSHHVVEPDHSTGEVVIPPGTGIFRTAFTAYMKGCTSIHHRQRPRANAPRHRPRRGHDRAHTLGRCACVLAIVDLWFYNEYADVAARWGPVPRLF